MRVSLTVVGGKHKGREIPIQVPEFLIGRDVKCHLRPSSNDISRHHCAIVSREGMVFLRDYGSRNGTILNRRMLVSGELQMEDGDLIEVGPLTFRLALALTEAVAVETQPDLGDADRIAAEIDDILGGDDLLAGGEPSPDDTVQVSKPQLPLPIKARKEPRDEQEILCNEP